MSKLTKTERIEVAYGEPPRPGNPAYCVKVIEGYKTTYTTITKQAGFSSGGGSSAGSSAAPSGVERVTITEVGPLGEVTTAQAWVPAGGAAGVKLPDGASGGASGGARQKVVTPVYKTTCFPATLPYPGTADEVIKHPGDGWNAGARSIDSIEIGHRFVANVPAGYVGVLVGVGNTAPGDGYPFDHAALAVAFQAGGAAQVVVAGAVAKKTAINAPSVDHQVEFRRDLDSVAVLIDGEPQFSLPMASGETLRAEASLYTVTDYVHGAAITPYAEGSGKLHVPAPGLLGSDVADYSLLPIPAPELSGEGEFSIGWHYGRLRVPAPLLAGNTDYIPPPIAYGGGALGAPMPALFGLSDAWTLARGTLPVPAFTMVGADVADYNFGALRTPIPSRIDLTLDDDPAGARALSQEIVLFDQFFLSAPVMIAFAEQLHVGEVVDFVLLFDLSFAERVELDSIGDFYANDSISFAEAIRFSDTSTMGRNALTYAVDLVTGALREYSDYGFTHYMNLGTELWAARPDGIYQLSSRSEAAQALLDLGVLDFGAGQQKRIATSWVGVRTDGQVYLRVTVDGREYVYRAVPHGGDVQRIGIGKGLSARHWKMRLEIEDATFASIDSVEFELGVSQRRKDGRRR